MFEYTCQLCTALLCNISHTISLLPGIRPSTDVLLEGGKSSNIWEQL